jgi:hypothetical protein
MSKFRGPGQRRADGPNRTNTRSSIRGKISAPIMVADDGFPIGMAGTGMTTSLGTDGMERQLQLRSSAVSAAVQQNRITVDGFGDSTRAEPLSSIPPQPSRESPPPPTNQSLALLVSMASTPSGISIGRTHRKKSSLRFVLGRLFSKTQKERRSLNVLGQGPGNFHGPDCNVSDDNQADS